MRWATLYARSRQVPRQLGTAFAAVAVVCLLWASFSHSPTVDLRLALVAVMMVAAACGLTLGTVDEQLERTASLNWPARRALHLLLVLGVLVLVVLGTHLVPAHFGPVAIVLRDALGLLGLTALGATLIGSELSWLGSVVWTLACILPFAQPSSKMLAQIAMWPVQPADATAALLSAAALALAGGLAYTFHGCPERAA